MKFQKLILLTSLSIVFLLQSCSEYKTTDGGVKYKIIVDSTNGPNLELGGLAYVTLSYANEKDTFHSKEVYGGAPIGIRLKDSVIVKGGFEDLFPLLSKGDSVTFIIRNDSLYKNIFGIPRPPEVKPENSTTFFMRVNKILSKDSVKYLENKMKEEQMAAQIRSQMQVQVDSIAIVEYCKKNKLNAKRTPEGVYYVIKKSAEGIALQPGDTAMTYYTGKLMDGTEFDSNGKSGRPFPVVVAMSQVIRGWHAGLMALKKGEKATLIIPSSLGYGSREQGPIPANSVLIFDIEVLK